MTPRKLSESDKQNILHLYRHPGETTSTLAERYGVSNTTISRVLKSLLPEREYEALVQQKRAARPQAGFAEFAAELAFEDEPIEASEVAQPTAPVAEFDAVAEGVAEPTPEVVAEVEDQPAEMSEAAIAELSASEDAIETVPVETFPLEAVAVEALPVEAVAVEALPVEAVAVEAVALEAVVTPVTKPAIAPPIKRRQRKRSSADDEATSAESPSEKPEVMESQLQLLDIPSAAPEGEKKQTKIPPVVRATVAPPIDGVGAEIAREVLSENLQAQAAELMDLEDEDDDLDDDDLDDDDLDDLDDDDDDEGDLDDAGSFMDGQLPTRAFVRVLPLAEASIPKTFYLVVDRMAELITRPLREFGDLGQIPSEDIQAKTLPIFDNHRVARRFSKRNQRVIKVPDGRMLPKVSGYLQAKGITRLLIDGQVYSL
ncbi:MAG: hypothetical protein KME12_17210 [Trichocoleus desertorum ATA4-8-CV12]|jgi:transposase-like protein|nr:hypothetical protein [Trichocoleus desertorum ATA4-8-CV12]